MVCLERFLQSVDPQLGVNERFLLAALMFAFDGRWGGIVVADVADRLAVSAKMVRNGFRLLCDAGCLVDDDRVTTSPGRPKLSFSLSADLKQARTEFSRAEAWGKQRQAILECLCGAAFSYDAKGDKGLGAKVGHGHPPTRTRSSELPVPARLIASLMVARSDELGCVQGISKARLRELTGISDSGVRKHVRELHQRGVILEAVPGVSSRLLAEHKVTSVYLLNLPDWPCLAGRFAGSCVFLDVEQADFHGELLEQLSFLSQVLRKQVMQVALDTLLFRLLQEAAKLVPSCPESLSSAQTFYVDYAGSSGLNNRVAALLHPQLAVYQAVYGHGIPANILSLLCERLVWFCIETAIRVRRILIDRGLRVDDLDELQIWPRLKGSKVRVCRLLFIAPGEGGAVYRCVPPACT